ncbi:NAD-dependent epimerase/dehydratase family protein [Pseudomonas sp. CCI2.4]|uniref:NAD-dependent epimerase/dehydratase family protein n=1 Tax=Pseudomonas sp. CCI2.4 TaxID=3048617 RepID=UPI002B23BCB0|nr:NAD-dependent epimerase/dehydratase family protein [Pseudomonas sp. CCI2.4]MEB0129234.1 NAD(P)H-binding protein [Pseudomonas sp. CCI2.4]
MAANNTVLVLGATGGIGGEVARQLRDEGWTVHALRRGNHLAPGLKDGITWIEGDASNHDDVMAAAQGCSVIVHAVNPAGYRRWATLVLPMLDNTIAAAKAHQATIVLPGTVYNFGPDAFPIIREDSLQDPATGKGKIRVEMERRLRAASTQGSRVIIVRAGDFFGPAAGSSWFSQGLVKPGTAVTKVNLPGAPGVGHQWSYIPDVARTMVSLIERRATLAPFAVFHMNGHWDNDGLQMAGAIQRIVAARGSKPPTLQPFPWWMIMLISPFKETFREVLEMRYLWRTPVRMNNAHLQATLGEEPHTPLDQAIEATLQGLGCLPSATRS